MLDLRSIQQLSHRVNQQFEIQRWPLTEVLWRALHKFGRNIGDLTGCKTSLVHYWFVSILTSYCACSCWNYTFTFWFLPGFSCIPFKFPSIQQFDQLELTRPGTVYVNSTTGGLSNLQLWLPSDACNSVNHLIFKISKDCTLLTSYNLSFKW